MISFFCPFGKGFNCNIVAPSPSSAFAFVAQQSTTMNLTETMTGELLTDLKLTSAHGLKTIQ